MDYNSRDRLKNYIQGGGGGLCPIQLHESWQPEGVLQTSKTIEALENTPVYSL
jgi:hypothetical protein